jgi:hypothetical protein
LQACKDLRNPPIKRPVKLDKVLSFNLLPKLHSLQIELPCQRRRIDQASDRIRDRKVTVKTPASRRQARRP